MDSIKLVSTDTGETEEFYIVEEARLGGRSYLLVTDSEEGDGMALILRDDAEDGSDESLLSVVEDEDELSSVLILFEDKLEDMGILIEEE